MNIYLCDSERISRNHFDEFIKAMDGDVYDSEIWRDRFDELISDCYIALINLHDMKLKCLDLNSGMDLGLCRFFIMLSLILVQNKELKEELIKKFGEENIITLDNNEKMQTAIMRLITILKSQEIICHENDVSNNYELGAIKRKRRDICIKLNREYKKHIKFYEGFLSDDFSDKYSERRKDDPIW
jgi:hypothetical protein